MVDTSLRAILIHKDVEGAISYVKSCISDLLMNRMDLSKLVRMFTFSLLIFRMISFIVYIPRILWTSLSWCAYYSSFLLLIVFRIISFIICYGPV